MVFVVLEVVLEVVLILVEAVFALGMSRSRGHVLRVMGVVTAMLVRLRSP